MCGLSCSWYTLQNLARSAPCAIIIRSAPPGCASIKGVTSYTPSSNATHTRPSRYFLNSVSEYIGNTLAGPSVSQCVSLLREIAAAAAAAANAAARITPLESIQELWAAAALASIGAEAVALVDRGLSWDTEDGVARRARPGRPEEAEVNRRSIAQNFALIQMSSASSTSSTSSSTSSIVYEQIVSAISRQVEHHDNSIQAVFSCACRSVHSPWSRSVRYCKLTITYTIIYIICLLRSGVGCCIRLTRSVQRLLKPKRYGQIERAKKGFQKSFFSLKL
jgi:hypothetical protein